MVSEKGNKGEFKWQTRDTAAIGRSASKAVRQMPMRGMAVSIVFSAAILMFGARASYAWVQITSPSNDGTVSGSVTVTAQVSSEWYSNLAVDGKWVAVSGVGNGTATFTWNTTGFSDGPHWVQVNGHQKGQSIPDSSYKVAVSVLNHPSLDTSTHFTSHLESDPLPSEAYCAAIIPYETEPVSTNTPNNNTQPTVTQLQSYAANGYAPNIYDGAWAYARVDGKYTGTTDMIMRWVACKWGLDEDLVRAQSMNESWAWNQNAHGDMRTTYSQCVNGSFSALWNYECTNCCYQSWSIFQVKVYYDWQTWPMIQQSTPFAADFRYANQRSCMNGDLKGYFSQFPDHNGHDYATDIANGDVSTIEWGCIGEHFSGQWYDNNAITYIGNVQKVLSAKSWKTKWPNVNWPN